MISQNIHHPPFPVEESRQTDITLRENPFLKKKGFENDVNTYVLKYIL